MVAETYVGPLSKLSVVLLASVSVSTRVTSDNVSAPELTTVMLYVIRSPRSVELFEFTSVIDETSLVTEIFEVAERFTTVSSFVVFPS